jgi:diguanylate cyclase (GGDEF)-like protein
MSQNATLPTSGTAAPDDSGAFYRPPARRRRDTQQREASPAKVKLHVLFLGLSALAASVVATLGDGPHSRDWVTFAALAVAAATAQLFVVQTTHNQSYHLAIVFVLAGVLLLPLELIAALCLIQHVPEWMRERYAPEIQGFNIANYTLAALAAWVAAHAVLGSSGVHQDARTVLAGVVAGAVFVLLNHGVLAGMLRIARGHSVRQSGLFSLESLSTDLVLAVVGVGLAASWKTNLWFASVAVAPLLLIHRALSIPRIRAEASRDPKTGLYNAGHLNSALVEEVERAARFTRPLSVIVADLDLLRNINNSYGHLSGDSVLRGVADAFHALLRPYDVAARFGGEEFAVLLPETEFEEAMAIADRIREVVAAQPFPRHGSDETITATLSLGVASYPRHATDADELVHQADLALYRSKALGRNRVCGASAETLVLAKRLHDTSARSDEAVGSVQAAPRGFRPYGPERRPAKAPSRLARLRAALRGWAGEMRVLLAGRSWKESGSRTERRVRGLIAVLSLGVASLLALNTGHLVHLIAEQPFAIGGFVLLVVTLQLLSVDLHGSGAQAASAIGMLSAGFVFGPAAAIAVAVAAGAAQWVVKRGLLHRALFDCSNLGLSAAAATYAYQAVTAFSGSTASRLVGAIVATVAFRVINSGLLCVVMSIAESLSAKAVWNERFRWGGMYHLAFGPLAFASAVAYEQMGFVGLMAFAVPPVLLTISVRQYFGHTRASVAEVRRANEELRRSNAELAESNQRVKHTHLATIAALSRSMEAKDQFTGSHTERVAAVAVALAVRSGYRDDELDAIEVGALLHDIGKIGIPESVLHKNGQLSDEEWNVMREHPVISDYILSEVDLHPFVRQIARWSHERIDGQGYPDGLSGNEIPLPARIVLVADAFDALTTDRPYRAGGSIHAALEELRDHAGSQFCPLVVDALVQLSREEPHLLGDRNLQLVSEVA